MADQQPPADADYGSNKETCSHRESRCGASRERALDSLRPQSQLAIALSSGNADSTVITTATATEIPKVAPPVAAPAGSPLQVFLLDALNMLRKRDSYEIFHCPVDTELVNSYLSVVSKPMDFWTMEQKVRRDEYNDFGEFCADVELIFSNCRSFNHPSTIFFKQAVVLAQWWGRLRRQLVGRLRELNLVPGAASPVAPAAVFPALVTRTVPRASRQGTSTVRALRAGTLQSACPTGASIGASTTLASGGGSTAACQSPANGIGSSGGVPPERLLAVAAGGNGRKRSSPQDMVQVLSTTKSDTTCSFRAFAASGARKRFRLPRISDDSISGPTTAVERSAATTVDGQPTTSIVTRLPSLQEYATSAPKSETVQSLLTTSGLEGLAKRLEACCVHDSDTFSLLVSFVKHLGKDAEAFVTTKLQLKTSLAEATCEPRTSPRPESSAARPAYNAPSHTEARAPCSATLKPLNRHSGWCLEDPELASFAQAFLGSRLYHLLTTDSAQTSAKLPPGGT